MATKKLKSLKGRVMRLTRLDECGVPDTGLAATMVTAGFVSVGWEFEVKEGDEYELENAWGDAYVDEKDPNRYRWVNLSITACEVDPDVLDIVTSATVITDGTDNIGNSFGTGLITNAFAIEVWTKQAGRNCSGGNPEWGYFLAPFVVDGSIADGFTIEKGTLTFSMSGRGIADIADWGEGPHGDNPLLETGGLTAGELMAVVRTTVQPPAESAPAALPAP